MPKTKFTPDELKQYFKGDYTYHYCDASKEKERDMRVHADGVFPECLIKDRRPNEPEIVLEYRQKIWIAKTKPYFSKIESTLQKIRRSSDWAIKYGDGSFDKVVDGEKMQDYADSKYPVFGSVTNWAFSLLLRNYLVDANALLLVAPLEVPTEENTYLRPVATIFNSENVIDYVEGDYAVMEHKIGTTYGARNTPGKSFFVVTTQSVTRYDQIDGRGNYSAAFYYEHNLGILPVFKLGGIVVDVYGHNTLYESRISGILPEFNEALRENSDLQAAVVLSMFPERWEYTNNECTGCKGTGKVPDIVEGQPCQSTCRTCDGIGYVAPGPYQKKLIKPAQENMGQSGMPTPPMGYVQGPVEIIKLQQESVSQHIYSGLSAINFEFLAATPLSQSGVAKEVDKDELNNTVHSVAEDMVRIIDLVYFYIALYRYSALYTPAEIREMLPSISVPEKYDILSTSYFVEQMKSAKEQDLNPAIINALEEQYAVKTFSADPSVAEHVGLVLKLDPLAGISEDAKMSRLSNGGITQLDYVASSNINKFVDQAIEANSLFVDMDTTRQRDEIYKMAQEQMDSENADIIPTDTNTDEPDANIVQ